MCGLVGSFAFADEQGEVLANDLRPLIARMARRGPDDEGAWSDGRRCALGFRRLSILDLTAAGHQPMATPDGRYHLVFNGEIYNYRELRDELAGRGYVFRSTGDAETLLAALATWGPSALERVNGMYALGLYDRLDQRLLLARDHAGIKPLHYAVTPRGVVFGSQYDQLLAHPWLRDARIDPGGLGLYLRFGFVPAPYGLHAGTHQVEAGQWLVFEPGGGMRRGRSFELPRWQRPDLSGDAALEAFDAAFDRAVRRHLISDVPVGVLLSGGIDSPLVAAAARAQHGAAIQAFTIAVDDPASDESADAARYAGELGLAHVVERVGAADALGLVDDVARASTEPTADHSMFPMLLVSRLARKHVKVVLSGDGGDELYWGYPSRFGSAIGQARYFGWPRLARMAAIGARRTVHRGAATRDVLEYPTLGRLYQRKHTLANEADLAQIVPSLPALPRAFTAFEFDGVDCDSAAQWVRWNEFQIHLARVLAKVDRASMFHSLEVRVPLLDREVIDVAWRTDWETSIDVATRVGKRVLRRALARRARHHTAGKRGFAVPMHEWLVGPLRPLLDELVVERGELGGVELDRGALRAIEQQLVAGDRSKAWGLWMLLALALWTRTHGASA
jgi:asparagine synthase (glutamine-hydrolysing)